MPGYKRVDGQEARRKLLSKIRGQIGLPADTSLLEESDYAIDAAVCVLAGADFLRGEVYEPRDLLLARKEGWIWVREGEGIRCTKNRAAMVLLPCFRFVFDLLVSYNVLRLQTFLDFDDGEFYALIFIQVAAAIANNGIKMAE